jgi:uncharacterized membrane protein YqaE (UPF0057 family)
MGKNDEIDDKIYTKIDNDNWTFYDKIVYGGLGYGNICLPSHLFDIIITVIFPPFGLILSKLDFKSSFPYIHWKTFDLVMENLSSIVKCFLLTMCFYVPGLIYALNLLKC